MNTTPTSNSCCCPNVGFKCARASLAVTGPRQPIRDRDAGSWPMRGQDSARSLVTSGPQWPGLGGTARSQGCHVPGLPPPPGPGSGRARTSPSRVECPVWAQCPCAPVPVKRHSASQLAPSTHSTCQASASYSERQD